MVAHGQGCGRAQALARRFSLLGAQRWRIAHQPTAASTPTGAIASGLRREPVPDPRRRSLRRSDPYNMARKLEMEARAKSKKLRQPQPFRAMAHSMEYFDETKSGISSKVYEPVKLAPSPFIWLLLAPCLNHRGKATTDTQYHLLAPSCAVSGGDAAQKARAAAGSSRLRAPILPCQASILGDQQHAQQVPRAHCRP